MKRRRTHAGVTVKTEVFRSDDDEPSRTSFLHDLSERRRKQRCEMDGIEYIPAIAPLAPRVPTQAEARKDYMREARAKYNLQRGHVPGPTRGKRVPSARKGVALSDEEIARRLAVIETHPDTDFSPDADPDELPDDYDDDDVQLGHIDPEQPDAAAMIDCRACK